LQFSAFLLRLRRKRLFGEGEIMQHLSQDGRTGGSMSKLSRLVLHVAHAASARDKNRKNRSLFVPKT
jgi:hypothetical protein